MAVEPKHLKKKKIKWNADFAAKGSHSINVYIPVCNVSSCSFCLLMIYNLSVHLIKCNFIQVESRRRFRILQSWDQDGWAASSFEYHIVYLPLLCWHQYKAFSFVDEVYVFLFFLYRYRVAEIEWVQDNSPEGLEQRTKVCFFFFFFFSSI